MTDMHLFQETVWQYYHGHGRHDLPWRQTNAHGVINPYHVVVSELMLQQTQVGRVLPKFETFIARFPSFDALAAAALANVLKEWNGLGYNRRAKFLWQTARAVSEQYKGVLPDTLPELVSLPGIGPNTAGAILAYAHNQPVVFIETNIRTVFIHHFFAGQTLVSDRDLEPLIRQALPVHEVREWYWALMDYGTYLKRTVGNISRASASYAKQSAFHGSRRQVRGRVLKLLAEGPRPLAALQAVIADERLESVLGDLMGEGFIQENNANYELRA